MCKTKLILKVEEQLLEKWKVQKYCWKKRIVKIIRIQHREKHVIKTSKMAILT